MEAIIFQKDEVGYERNSQEDSHDIAPHTPNGSVFIVCDGMGGYVGGKKASSLAVESIIEYLQKEEYPNPLKALNDALQFANSQILGYANAHPELKGMGTTACILLLQDDKAYIAHVGDSRIYLYLGKEKQLHRITKDHSYVQTLVDAGELTDEEAERHPNKNRILKALGLKPELQPTFNYQNKPILPKNDDIFLICSDGLNGMISDNTIQKVLSQNTTIEQKGEKLIAYALEGENGQLGGQDNVTVELIQISSSKHKKSVFTSLNPPNKPQVSVSKSRKSMKTVKCVATAIVVLAVGILAGMYLYGSHQRTSALKNERNNFETSIMELQITKNQYFTILSDDELISEIETNISKPDFDTAQILDEIHISNGQIEKTTSPELKKSVEKYREEKIGEFEKASKANKAYNENHEKLKNIIANYISKTDSIKKMPLYKFIIPKKNESNNNRKNSGQ